MMTRVHNARESIGTSSPGRDAGYSSFAELVQVQGILVHHNRLLGRLTMCSTTQQVVHDDRLGRPAVIQGREEHHISRHKRAHSYSKNAKA